MNLPEGTVTFLLTDIEGSTRLWQAQPDDMGPAVARHSALIAQAVADNGGVLVKGRGEGDSTFSVFVRPTQAISAAVAIQAELRTEAWPAGIDLRVRSALHTGQAELREGDYYGSVVNRAARLRDIAHGGQTICSETTAALADGHLPDGAALVEHGPHRLRDFDQPERVYEVRGAGVKDFPPLRSASALHNLPAELTSLVGRDADVEHVRALIRTERLVTLTGAAGCGKTRLALRAAAGIVHELRDGVWLVELASLAEPDLVVAAVATALGLTERTTGGTLDAGPAEARSIRDRLLDFLRHKTIVLVLDNCEHLLTSCTELVNLLLRDAANVTILATSREPLGMPGEKSWRVPSLELPDPAGDPQTIAATPAAQLFWDRARDVAITPENARAVAEICAQLDGIPLAIELAAARVPVLSPPQVAERLKDRLRLLTGGSRTVLERQQTLRAAVDWSYALLSDAERILLQRLTVFAGGFTLEAAEAVCSDSAVDSADILDLLTQLYRKSLLHIDDSSGTPRYRMLEMIRQYGREKLLDSDAGSVFRDRHLSFFVGFAEQAKDGVRGPQTRQWNASVEAELDNLRTAMEWSLGSEDALRIAVALAIYWRLQGFMSETRSWLQRGLDAATEVPGALRGEALVALGQATAFLGEFDVGLALIDQAEALAEELADEASLVFARARRIMTVYARGNGQEVDTLAAETLERARTIGDRWSAFILRLVLDRNAWERLDYETSSRYAAENLGAAREMGYLWGIAVMLHDLGFAAGLSGDLEKGRGYLAESMQVAEQAGLVSIHRVAQGALARVELNEGNPELAWELMRASLATLARMESPRDTAITFASSLRVLAGLGRFEPAATIAGAYDALEEELGLSRPAYFVELHEQALANVRGALGDARFSSLRAEGRQLETEEAIAFLLEQPPA